MYIMKKWIITLSITLVLVVFVIGGIIWYSFSYFSKDKKDNPAVLANEENKNVVDTSFSDITVSPNAEVVLTQKYEKCGHTKETKEMVPREVVNLNKEKVAQYYEGWNIDKFSANELAVSRNNTGICDEHYILRESDGYISISCKNDIGEYIFKGLTDIPVQYLPENDLEKLQNGIEIVGKENLNKFLEDFE